MDTKKLIQAIKMLVESEVKRKFAEEKKFLKESIIKELKQQPIKQSTKPMEKDPLDVDHLFETKKPQTQKKLFSNSSPISSILNETYQSGEWRDINSGRSFTSDMAQSFGSMKGMGMMEESVVQDSEGRAIPMETLAKTDAGAAVVDALTKDYSALMQAMNNKKKR